MKNFFKKYFNYNNVLIIFNLIKNLLFKVLLTLSSVKSKLIIYFKSSYIIQNGFYSVLKITTKCIFTTDHKLIGQMYVCLGTFSAIIGSTMSFVIRLQLSTHSNALFFDNPGAYNALVTMHGIIMIFFFVMPILIGGFGNIFLPIMIGAPEVAFPRLNNISFWLLFGAFLMMLLSIYSSSGAYYGAATG